MLSSFFPSCRSFEKPLCYCHPSTCKWRWNQPWETLLLNFSASHWSVHDLNHVWQERDKNKLSPVVQFWVKIFERTLFEVFDLYFPKWIRSIIIFCKHKFCSVLQLSKFFFSRANVSRSRGFWSRLLHVQYVRDSKQQNITVFQELVQIHAMYIFCSWFRNLL